MKINGILNWKQSNVTTFDLNHLGYFLFFDISKSKEINVTYVLKTYKLLKANNV